MIIVLGTQPNNRPPTVGGPPLQVGDIWIHPLTGARQRYDGAAWSVFTPLIIFAGPAPTVRPAGGGPLQFGDIWVQQTSGVQARWDGAAWQVVEPPAGIVVPSGRTIEHLAKASARSFDTRWVDPADGIAFLYRQQTAALTWTILHELRSQWVGVTVIDDSRVPPVTMIPDIEYHFNECVLRFAAARSGFAVIHASKPDPDITV